MGVMDNEAAVTRIRTQYPNRPSLVRGSTDDLLRLKSILQVVVQLEF